MKTKIAQHLKIPLNIVYYSCFLLLIIRCNSGYENRSENQNRKPTIFPDYTNLVIPCNIAPLNFIINESGNKYIVKFTSNNDKGFIIKSNSQKIIIPEKKWKSLLKNNLNTSFSIKVYVKDKNKKWLSFNEFNDSVVNDKIDAYFVYRKINTGMVFWNNMSIQQRSLENYDEFELVNNKFSRNGCINCHTFQKNNPENMMLHFRANPSGTLIKTKMKYNWLSTATKYTLSGFVYPSWHPNLNIIAFSTNKITQDFYGHENRINFVKDGASDIVLYNINQNKVFTSPEISTLDLENLPTWSPDGKTLYFIRCLKRGMKLIDTLVKYDLMRIPYNPDKEEFGKAETILASSETGMSISFPSVSPDGKFLAFLMADYGYFNINNPTSDLYIMDLETLTYSKANINSEAAESFHDWSINGRWLMFTSKRIDGLITIPFFSYFDNKGIAHKPFPLPAKDPETLKTRLFNYNRPVFVNGKINIEESELLNITETKTTNVWFDTINVDLDAIAGATLSNDDNSDQSSLPYMNR